MFPATAPFANHSLILPLSFEVTPATGLIWIEFNEFQYVHINFLIQIPFFRATKVHLGMITDNQFFN